MQLSVQFKYLIIKLTKKGPNTLLLILPMPATQTNYYKIGIYKNIAPTPLINH